MKMKQTAPTLRQLQRKSQVRRFWRTVALLMLAIAALAWLGWRAPQRSTRPAAVIVEDPPPPNAPLTKEPPNAQNNDVGGPPLKANPAPSSPPSARVPAIEPQPPKVSR